MGRAFEYRRAAKEARWGKMSRLFPKLAKAITVAAKEGGPDPESNGKLRTAINNAKAQNMPKDNVDAAIKRATNKDTANYTEINYEGKAPYGVAIFVECATDNTNRTFANVRSYFTKAGGTLGTSGTLDFLFSRKSVFQVLNDGAIDREELEFELIDFGLEEISEVEDKLYIYADYTDFGQMQKALEEKGVAIINASLQRIPTMPIELTDEQIAEIDKLIDKLEEDDDVQAVFTNIG